jgi:RNase P subunit RPR2
MPVEMEQEIARIRCLNSGELLYQYRQMFYRHDQDEMWHLRVSCMETEMLGRMARNVKIPQDGKGYRNV